MSHEDSDTLYAGTRTPTTFYRAGTFYTQTHVRVHIPTPHSALDNQLSQVLPQ